MAFLESPRFPETIALGAEGGPAFNTRMSRRTSGHEQRNRGWSQPLRRFRVSMINREQADYDTFQSFFLCLGGMADGFRVKHWADYTVTAANGFLGTGVGTGAPTYQLRKRYTSGSATHNRDLTKPVVGTVAAFRNASPLTVGASPGNIALDTTTGIVTFVPDSTKTITNITQANPGVVTATAHGFSNGDLIYIDGVVGMTQVNGVVFTIGGVAANTFTLGVNTTSYTAYSSGGNAKKFPQAGDALTFSGEFDVPCRFDADEMISAARKFAGGRLAHTFETIILQEIRPRP